MLKEDQAVELLNRCETAVGKRLVQTRGNLRRSATRSAALWELLVIDTASQIGPVEYEPSTRSPDVRIQIPQGRTIWLEAAFLDPRFWKNKRKSRQMAAWINEELRRHGIPPGRVHYRYEAKGMSEAGPVLQFPNLNERKEFLAEPGLTAFFDAIQAAPNEERTHDSSSYSLSIYYSPRGEGPHSSSSGPAQEAPRSIEEHALYRILMNKSRQHDVDLPLVVCVGGDRSQALSSMSAPGELRVRDAVQGAFARTGALSAVIVVRVDSSSGARGELFVNPNARIALDESEVEALLRMNFNRWRYTFAIQKWEQPGSEGWLRRASGALVSKHLGGAGMEIEIEIPSNVLVKCLAGKTNLATEFPINKDDPVFRALSGEWTIEDCRFRPGDPQAGQAGTVILKLSVIPPIYGLVDRSG